MFCIFILKRTEYGENDNDNQRNNKKNEHFSFSSSPRYVRFECKENSVKPREEKLAQFIIERQWTQIHCQVIITNIKVLRIYIFTKMLFLSLAVTHSMLIKQMKLYIKLC